MNPPASKYREILTEMYPAAPHTADYVRNSCLLVMADTIETLEKTVGAQTQIIGLLMEDFKMRSAAQASAHAPAPAATATVPPVTAATAAPVEEEDEPVIRSKVTNVQHVVNIPPPAKVSPGVTTNGGVISSAPSAQS